MVRLRQGGNATRWSYSKDRPFAAVIERFRCIERCPGQSGLNGCRRRVVTTVGGRRVPVPARRHHGQPLRPDNVSSRFNQLAAAAGVRPLGRTRSGTCSPRTCWISRYGIPEVAERLDHDPATLMRHYSRVNAGHRRQAADDLAELVAPAEAVTHLDAVAGTLTAT
ncbi:hypothetical protein AB0H83_36685 [Dactylosporangium sp. NPDC050688]|uniref:hypothetical protein n=1 Tax=Dactylosporangium sp. NPDC050688 TaxID=3157217 RepID=UPI0033E8F117